MQLYELIGAEDLATTYNNLGVGFSTSMNYDSAFYYYKKAYQFLSETKDLGSQVLTLGNIAQVKYQMGQIDTALILSKKVLQLSANYFSLPQIIQAHNTITRVYFQYGELDSAEYHAQKVMELASDRAFLSGQVLGSIIYTRFITAKGIMNWPMLTYKLITPKMTPYKAKKHVPNWPVLKPNMTIKTNLIFKPKSLNLN